MDIAASANERVQNFLLVNACRDVHIRAFLVKRPRWYVCQEHPIHILLIKLSINFGFVACCTSSRINFAAGTLVGPKIDKSKVSYEPWCFRRERKL